MRRAGALIPLTPIEFDLLDALSGAPNVAFTRRQLIEHVWGANYYGDEHLVSRQRTPALFHDSPIKIPQIAAV